MLQNYINKKVLITTQWFHGKDGKQYKAIFGTLKGIHESGKTLGFIPNRSHANWFIEVGDMIIMGCQVMYLQQINEIYQGDVDDWKEDDKGDILNFKRPTTIYVVE